MMEAEQTSETLVFIFIYIYVAFHFRIFLYPPTSRRQKKRNFHPTLEGPYILLWGMLL
jgi:hypothetical protein